MIDFKWLEVILIVHAIILLIQTAIKF